MTLSIWKTCKRWTHSTALRKLKIVWGSIEKDELKTPLPNLSFLSSLELTDVHMPSLVFGAITKNRKALEEISFMLEDFNQGLELKQLVTCNKKLRKVSVSLPLDNWEGRGSDYYYFDKNELEMTSETLRIFPKCEKLNELSLRGHNFARIDYDLKCRRHPEIDNMLSYALLRR